MYQYRITLDGTTKDHATYPEKQWELAAEVAQERGYLASLERRFVTDLSYIEWYPDGILPDGYRVFKDKIASPWQVIAEIGIERRCVIVG